MTKSDVTNYILRELDRACPYPKNTAAAQIWQRGFLASQLAEAVLKDSKTLDLFRATVKRNLDRAYVSDQEKQ